MYINTSHNRIYINNITSELASDILKKNNNPLLFNFTYHCYEPLLLDTNVMFVPKNIKIVNLCIYNNDGKYLKIYGKNIEYLFISQRLNIDISNLKNIRHIEFIACNIISYNIFNKLELFKYNSYSYDSKLPNIKSKKILQITNINNFYYIYNIENKKAYCRKRIYFYCMIGRITNQILNKKYIKISKIKKTNGLSDKYIYNSVIIYINSICTII